MPLLLSLALSGTAADDRLAPALHSRSGGTSSTKGPERSLTSFRRGTTVWYLSESAGAPCPFKRAGLCLDESAVPCKGTKRKREPHHTPPRKFSASGPAMATRTRTQAQAANPTPSRLRLRLTLKVAEPPPSSPSDAKSQTGSFDSDLSDLSDLDPESDHDGRSYTDPVPSMSVDGSPTDEASSASDLDANTQVQAVPTFSPDLPPYPILSASIPSPSCTTPATSLASPSITFSDPFSLHGNSPLCSSHSINVPFSSFRMALSNPPRDHRARSRSLPFSAASPPPDSEDEDEDYHNSMVGLRRGSAPLSLKKEEDGELMKSEPVTPRYIHGAAHFTMKDWESEVLATLRQAHTTDDVSAPLELLPGFISFSPEPEPVDLPVRLPVKDEPTSAVLPPAEPRVLQRSGMCLKPEHASDDEQTVLDPDEAPFQLACGGKGTREDPVRIDTVVGDVEILGPESVRSREWDAAWCCVAVDVAEHDDAVEGMDDVSEAGCSRTPSERSVFMRREVDLRASPAETLATVPTSISSPPLELQMPMDGERDLPILMHPFRPCDPPVVAMVIDGMSLPPDLGLFLIISHFKVSPCTIRSLLPVCLSCAASTRPS